MSNIQLVIVVFIPTLAVLVGILVNQSGLNSLRSDTQSGFNSLREDVRMLTGKVIELTDRVSHLEAKISHN